MSSYKFNFECIDADIAILYFHKQHYNSIMFSILKDILIKTDVEFVSLTLNNDEISLFVDDKHVPDITSVNYTIEKGYKVIRVYDYNDGIENIGVVSKLSSLLSSNNIPILYVNSYNNNYILVKDNYLDKTLESLSTVGLVF